MSFVHSPSVSVALQSKTCDLLQAHTECRCLLVSIMIDRCEGSIKKLFCRATQIIKNTFGEEEEPTRPRSNTKKRQMHRAKAPAETPEEFYRLNYHYAFLDHVMSHLQMRFPKDLKDVTIMLGFYLLPCHLNQLTEELEQSIVEEYNTCQCLSHLG